jgi:hypothetical protein
MKKRKITRVKTVKKGAHHVGVLKQIAKGSLQKHFTNKRYAEQRAILEGVQRIADLASGKVKGLSEKEWKEETRRRLAEIAAGPTKALAGKQLSAQIKENIKVAIAEAVEMNDEFGPSRAFLRNALLLRGVTFVKGLLGQSTEKQLRKLQGQKTEPEFFVVLAMLAIENNPIKHGPGGAEDDEADWLILLTKMCTGWSAELKAMWGVQALGRTKKQAADELKKRVALQLQTAKIERAWWDEP